MFRSSFHDVSKMIQTGDKHMNGTDSTVLPAAWQEIHVVEA